MDRIVRLIFLICIRFLWRWRKKIPRRKRNTWGSVAEGENRKLIKQSIERKTASTSPRPRFSREDWKVKRKTGERRGVIREPFDEKEIFIKRKKKEVAMKNIDIKKKKKRKAKKRHEDFDPADGTEIRILMELPGPTSSRSRLDGEEVDSLLKRVRDHPSISFSDSRGCEKACSIPFAVIKNRWI